MGKRSRFDRSIQQKSGVQWPAWLRFAILSLLSTTMILTGAGNGWLSLPLPPVQAQTSVPYVRPETIANQLYQQFSEFPKEDQYPVLDRNIGSQSTLAERLILYHTKLKGRSPLSRFDWKITLADYLGINDLINLQGYPGSSYLKQNPMEGDRGVIRKLTRDQRNLLVQTLVDLYSKTLPAPTVAPAITPQPKSISSPSPAPPPGPTNKLKPLPRSGDAQLLAPPAPPAPAPAPKPQGDAGLLAP